MDARSFRRPLSLAAIAALGACFSFSRTVHYGPARDDPAMAAIASTFAEGSPGGVVLSLCEDVAAAPGWSPDCQEQHVVRGGGRGLAHEEEIGWIGCGGCPFEVVAYVVGTVEGGPFAQQTPVRGIIRLQSGHDDDPYAYPYSVDVMCDGAVACQIAGHLDEMGRMSVGITAEGSAYHTLVRQGAASCP